MTSSVRGGNTGRTPSPTAGSSDHAANNVEPKATPASASKPADDSANGGAGTGGDAGMNDNKGKVVDTTSTGTDTKSADPKTDTPTDDTKKTDDAAEETPSRWDSVKEFAGGLAGSVAMAGAGTMAMNMLSGSGSSEPAASGGGAGGGGASGGDPASASSAVTGGGASGNPQGGMAGGMGGGVGNGIGAPKNFLNSPNTGGIPTGNINMSMPNPSSGGGLANFSSNIPSADSMFNMSGDHNRQLISAPISTPNNGMMDMGMMGGMGAMGAMSMMGSMGMMPFGMI